MSAFGLPDDPPQMGPRAPNAPPKWVPGPLDLGIGRQLDLGIGRQLDLGIGSNWTWDGPIGELFGAIGTHLGVTILLAPWDAFGGTMDQGKVIGA